MRSLSHTNGLPSARCRSAAGTVLFEGARADLSAPMALFRCCATAGGAVLTREAMAGCLPDATARTPWTWRSAGCASPCRTRAWSQRWSSAATG